MKYYMDKIKCNIFFLYKTWTSNTKLKTALQWPKFSVIIAVLVEPLPPPNISSWSIPFRFNIVFPSRSILPHIPHITSFKTNLSITHCDDYIQCKADLYLILLSVLPDILTDWLTDWLIGMLLVSKFGLVEENFIEVFINIITMVFFSSSFLM